MGMVTSVAKFNRSVSRETWDPVLRIGPCCGSFLQDKGLKLVVSEANSK
jgi:hypothetical protein